MTRYERAYLLAREVILLRPFLAPAMQQAVQNQAEALDVKAVIDQALIQDII